jgi:hypothetical protein
MGDQFEDLKSIKSLLNTLPSNHDQLILFGASLEALRDLKMKTDKIHEKLLTMESRLADMDKAPRRSVNVTRIIQQQASPDATPKPRDPMKDPQVQPDFPHRELAEAVMSQPEPIVFVSDKRRESVQNALRQHGRLTSGQMSKIIGLSRTRCNEYLKDMEREGLVQATLEDKKKFYSLVR